MKALARLLWQQLGRTIRHPTRLLNWLQRDARRDYLRSLQRSVDHAVSWRPAPRGFERRQYGSYEEYLNHQRAKLRRFDRKALEQSDHAYRLALATRLRTAGFVRSGERVLCLGARRGGEVASFRDLGCFAVGIDLNPGEGNPFVLPGDFHRLDYPDGCVDVVFTNCLDHAFDLEKILAEVSRVLAEGGRFIVEAYPGTAEGKERDRYDALWWPTIDALVKVLGEEGFQVVIRQPFDIPFLGEHMVLRPRARGQVPDARGRARAPTARRR